MNEQPIDTKDLIMGAYVRDSEGLTREVMQVSNSPEFRPMLRVVLDPRRLDIIPCEKLAPIPITPEWLRGFGLKVDIGGTWDFPTKGHYVYQKTFALTAPPIRYNDPYIGWLLCVYDGDDYTNIRVSSIHQLQALYWNIERIWLTLDKKEVGHE